MSASYTNLHYIEGWFLIHMKGEIINPENLIFTYRNVGLVTCFPSNWGGGGYFTYPSCKELTEFFFFYC